MDSQIKINGSSIDEKFAAFQATFLNDTWDALDQLRGAFNVAFAFLLADLQEDYHSADSTSWQAYCAGEADAWTSLYGKKAWTSLYGKKPVFRGHVFECIPKLFLEYQEGFQDGTADVVFQIKEEREFDEKQKAKRAAEERAVKVRALVANDDWCALALPTPSELLGNLLSGQSSDVQGHFIDYDKSDDVVWITNPYGIDLILCQGRPSEQTIRRFLVNLAMGRDYGPSPG